MTMQTMKSFLEKANSDQDLAEALVAIIDGNEPDTIYPQVVALAGQHGFIVTIEDVEEIHKQCSAFDETTEGDLDDDALADVAGGGVAMTALGAGIGASVYGSHAASSGGNTGDVAQAAGMGALQGASFGATGRTADEWVSQARSVGNLGRKIFKGW